MAVPPPCEGVLVDVLAEAAMGYPDRGVQAAAADCTRVRAARLLPGAAPAEAYSLAQVESDISRDAQSRAGGRPSLLQDVMRGPSDWSVAERELFAAFVSAQNQCPF